MGTVGLVEGTRGRPASSHWLALRPRLARTGHALCFSPLPGLQRVRCAARLAPPDPRTRRPAQRRQPAARQRCEALTRRHPRARIHRATAAGGARRAVPRAAHPSHAQRAETLGHGPAATGRHGAGVGPVLCVFAPGGAPHPVFGRPANPCPAHRSGRPALDRADAGAG